MPFSNATYTLRRNRFAELLSDGTAIIPTAEELPRNSDVDFPFRPNSYFSYLTGFAEPESVLVVVGGADPKSVLFVRDNDPARETWTGKRLGPSGAKTLGFDETYSITLLPTKIPELLSGVHGVHLLTGKDVWDPPKLGQCLTDCGYPKSVRGDVRLLLDGMRLIKDPQEISTMRHAAAISSAAHQRVIAKCKPGMWEYQLEAEFFHEVRSHGAGSMPAYPSIVAGGNNACTLHYVNNDCVLQDGNLVLVDAGCELDYYASDITRTYPVNGKFSPEQRALYELVLEAQMAAIAEVMPGKKMLEPQATARKIIVSGLVDLGILKGDPREIIREERHMPFLLHSVSHFLGLDVHDVGDYRKDDKGEKHVVLEPGMVITVEPGIYIPRGTEGVDPKCYGIGIRIEDDVLVTEEGHDVLSSAPKTVAEIESLMA